MWDVFHTLMLIAMAALVFLAWYLFFSGDE